MTEPTRKSCIECAFCVPSFNLLFCELQGIKVKADERCENFYPRSEVEKFLDEEDDLIDLYYENQP